MGRVAAAVAWYEMEIHSAVHHRSGITEMHEMLRMHVALPGAGAAARPQFRAQRTWPRVDARNMAVMPGFA